MNGDWQLVLGAQWRAIPSGPIFEMSEPPAELLSGLPQDYLAAAKEFGGREGFLGETYLRFYRLQELVALNLAYDVPTLLPEVIVFASNGAGEAFAFRLNQPGVFRVPFLPLGADYVERQSASFSEFVRSLASDRVSALHKVETVGMEVHDKLPICLGGSPTDAANKVLVPAAKHAELCRYWNKVYRDLLGREQSSAE